MTYPETLAYMYDKLPMYQRIGGAAYKADLHNTIRLCALLGNPEKKIRSVHVAGTNGKGSTSHLIASVLQQAGLKTALYTSPHLRDFRERIRINGAMIPEMEVIRFIEKWKDQFEEIGLSFFEMTVGMAFDYFQREKVDIAVIEVGMGGRLDSTNVITPLVSVITNIGLDHTRFLGDTLQKITREKAGIIKPKVPLVVGETQQEIAAIFEEIARLAESSFTYADKLWKVVKEENGKITVYFDQKSFVEQIEFPLGGNYQQRNLCTALEALRIYSIQTGFELSKETIASGLAGVVANTGLQGRWQTLGKRPLVICDNGHNPDGIRQVMENIRETPHNKLHFVFGMVNDKNTEGILSLLPESARYYFCKPAIPRGLEAEVLAGEAKKFGLDGQVYQSVREALEAAKKTAKEDDLIFVGGSTFVVAAVL
jgi:dihydrofolate synthase / folylpolyglutamate synthase